MEIPIKKVTSQTKKTKKSKIQSPRRKNSNDKIKATNNTPRRS